MKKSRTIIAIPQEFLGKTCSYLYGWDSGIIKGEQPWWEDDGPKSVQKFPPVIFVDQYGDDIWIVIADKNGIGIRKNSNEDFRMYYKNIETKTQEDAIELIKSLPDDLSDVRQLEQIGFWKEDV